MLKSMTGFGQAVLENEKYRITADVKTVNRFSYYLNSNRRIKL